MRQPADGRTLFIAANGITTQRHYLPQTRDPLNELSIVSMIADSPMVLMVANNVPVSNAREFIDYASRNPNLLNYATVGQGGTLQMAADLMRRATNVSMVPIPYQGGAPASLDLTAGRIQALFDSVAVGMQTARAGNARAMIVTSAERSRLAPNVVTFRELGYDIDFVPWQAVFVSAATPEPVKYRLNNVIRRALRNPAVVQRYMDLGMERVLGTSVFDSERLLNEELTRWNQILGTGR